MKLPLPTTNIQEVLYTLIIQGHVSILDYPYLSGFRTRVSEIVRKHGIHLNKKHDTRCNKFGNEYTYTIHFLPKQLKQKAIETYIKITNK
jgi:hypothetical protein